ncbi:MAG: hypothetical protein KDA94_14025, partial [Acidimicrobiales bacterium]|nr:hypothetical protein [Acidimicrobiales bacterium]
YFAAGIRPDIDDLDNSPIVMWEFTCGSLTADPDVRKAYFPNLPTAEAEAAVHSLEAAFLGINPQVDYIDMLNQGYGIITITPTESKVDFRIIDTFDVDAVATTKRSYAIPVGSLPAGTCGNELPPTETTTTTAAPTTTDATAPAPAAQPVTGAPTYTG